MDVVDDVENSVLTSAPLWVRIPLYHSTATLLGWQSNFLFRLKTQNRWMQWMGDENRVVAR